MSELPTPDVPRLRPGQFALAILTGGLACGMLDFAFAVVYYGAPWEAIGRSVARGVLSKETVATAQGWIAALGIGLHFLISFGAAAAYTLARYLLPSLTRHPAPAGLVYGAIVYFVMNWIIVPASAIQVRNYPPSVDWGALVGHMVLVGLPIALAAHWCLRNTSDPRTSSAQEL